MLPRAVGQESAGVLIDDDDAAVNNLVLVPSDIAMSSDECVSDEFLGASGGAEDGVVRVLEVLCAAVASTALELDLSADVVNGVVGALVEHLGDASGLRV